MTALVKGTARQAMAARAVRPYGGVVALGTAGSDIASTPIGPLAPGVLPAGVRSRFVENVNGIRVHVLEAGFEGSDRPAVLLIHGFPELAFSWRRVMPQLAAAGFHVIAPDLRGYGRTDGTGVTFDEDPTPYRTLNRVLDMTALVSAFGYTSVAAVVGHDVGSAVAAWSSIVQPDIFRATVLMSTPFGGTPGLLFDTANQPRIEPAADPRDDIYEQLAQLSPPRKHFGEFYATREANGNMWRAPQGLHAFLRAYYHMKSADWERNEPHPLAASTAEEWAKLPRYYVMDLDRGMAEQVAPEMPSAAEIAANVWLPDRDLRVYVEEYERNGFQGGLQSYRLDFRGRSSVDLGLFAGRTIDQPSMFIAGKSDWGVFQVPGSLERMQGSACTEMLGVHLLEGAGHWVQQEQADQVSELLLGFLRDPAVRAQRSKAGTSDG
jgi:pimeloyl-ACP methyl ester carboxylesterase